MRRTLGAALGLALILVMAVTVGEASAAKRAVSRIEITKATGDAQHVEVEGKVRSLKQRCRKNRKVSVWHDVPESGPSSQDFLIGTTRTDGAGRWNLTSVALPDKVYAVVKRNRFCKGDVSPTEAVKFKRTG